MSRLQSSVGAVEKDVRRLTSGEELALAVDQFSSSRRLSRRARSVASINTAEDGHERPELVLIGRNQTAIVASIMAASTGQRFIENR